jgi:hypothetical protein
MLCPATPGRPPLNRCFVVTVFATAAMSFLATPSASAAPTGCSGTWTVQASPAVAGPVAGLSGVSARAPNDVWAVGTRIDPEGAFRMFTEHWDGTAWTLVRPARPGSRGFFDEVAVVSRNNVWAVGQTIYQGPLAEHWDGRAWRIVPTPWPGPNGAELSGVVALSGDDVWAVGFNTTKRIARTLVEHWNGNAWTMIPSPNRGRFYNELFDVDATSPVDIWAVGTYYGPRGNQDALIEHWDGAAWSAIPTPNRATRDDQLTGVSALGSNDVWAVGYFYNDAGQHPLAEHWDGSAWHLVPAPGDTRTGGGSLYSVAAISASDVWAVGDSQTFLEPGRGLIEHWNGIRWSPVPSPKSFGLGSVDSSRGAIWAVGDVGHQFNMRPLIERFC